MKCHNDSNKSFTGKENTPLGRGYSACAEEEGKRMRGKDGKTYEVKKYSNGKRWVSVVSSKKKASSPSRKKKTARGFLKNPKHNQGWDSRGERSLSQAMGVAISGDTGESVISAWPMNISDGKPEMLPRELFSLLSKERLNRLGRHAFQQQYDNNMIKIMNELKLDDHDIHTMGIQEHDAIDNLAMENSPGELESKLKKMKVMMYYQGFTSWRGENELEPYRKDSTAIWEERDMWGGLPPGGIQSHRRRNRWGDFDPDEHDRMKADLINSVRESE